MSVKIKRTSAIGSLSITPLIDVVFLLLIFFLVSSRFADEERELDLNLPSVTEALPATVQPDEIVINVSEKGEYFINGAYRQVEQVKQILNRAKADNPSSQTVVIRGDQKASWNSIATAIGLCKEVGISDFSATIDGE